MSIQLFLVDKLIRLTMKRRFGRDPDVMQLRALMADQPPRPVPAHVKLEQTTLGGIPTERLSVDGADDAKALLYIHGGGFVGGAPSTHRPLTWRLAAGIAAPVYAIDYRLAPEHPFPAGLDDCLAAYRALLEKPIPPGSIIVGGDSAGGNLTLALMHKLKALGLPMPAAIVCLSPVTDFARDFDSRTRNARSDAMFVPAMLGSVTGRYCPNRDLADPLLSPLAGDVRGFPPALFQCSAAEMLCDDTIEMTARLREAGTPVEIAVWPKVFHVWQLMSDYLPEGREATADIVAFVNRSWTPDVTAGNCEGDRGGRAPRVSDRPSGGHRFSVPVRPSDQSASRLRFSLSGSRA
jgi:acetyl esterase/lipase